MSLQAILNLNKTETKTLNVVTKAYGRKGSSMDVWSIAESVGKSESYIRKVLKNLERKGLVRNDGTPISVSYVVD